MNPFILFLDEVAASAEGAPSGIGQYSGILMIVLMFAVMYLLIIRPEKKKKEKAQQMQDSLVNGDEITTIGGITGKVVQVAGDTVTFETGEDRVRIQVKKWAISTTAKVEAAEAAENSGKLFGKK